MKATRKKLPTSVLYVRDFPKDITRAIKIEALKAQMPMGAFLATFLTQHGLMKSALDNASVPCYREESMSAR